MPNEIIFREIQIKITVIYIYKTIMTKMKKLTYTKSQWVSFLFLKINHHKLSSLKY